MAGLGGLKDVVTGDWLAKDENKKAKAEIDALKALYGGIETPNLGDVDLQHYGWQGDLTPEQIQNLDPVQYQAIQSAMGGVSSDPRLRDQQMASLAALQDLASSGGMNAKDKANLARVQSETAQADRGRREAIQQGMARRGMGGSGMDMLAQLQSSQAATDRNAQQGLDIAGMAQERALQAMMQGGSMAGNMRDQDFGEQSKIAAAKDAIAQFNAANTLKTGMYNQDMTRDADKYNAGVKYDSAKYNNVGRQHVSDANTDVTNKQTMTNKVDLPQQNFQNTMSKAGGQAQGYKASADYWKDKGASAAAGGQRLLSGAIRAGTAAATGGGSEVAGAAAGGEELAGEDDDYTKFGSYT